MFSVGLMMCASVMHGFEALLERELELAFFVPLLIGSGGNSGGQCVSTVIRALGSGAAKLSDAPRIILKEAAAGLVQAVVLACFLGPSLYMVLGTSLNVTVIVTLTLPCLGFGANALGASLVFGVQQFGYDPAVIVGPLLTTTVDSLGLLTYLGIATIYLRASADTPAPACDMHWGTCIPANAYTSECKLAFPFRCSAA